MTGTGPSRYYRQQRQHSRPSQAWRRPRPSRRDIRHDTSCTRRHSSARAGICSHPSDACITSFPRPRLMSPQPRPRHRHGNHMSRPRRSPEPIMSNSLNGPEVSRAAHGEARRSGSIDQRHSMTRGSSASPLRSLADSDALSLHHPQNTQQNGYRHDQQMF